MVNVTSALTIDLHVGRPGTAQAVSLCFRYLVAAEVVAGALPLVDTVGIGWMGTIIAGGLVDCVNDALGLVLLWA